jgi:hypothetical protein
MSAMPVAECPEPLRQALLDLLAWTLLSIRNQSADANLCYAYADHMHNVPDLLAHFHPDRLAFYWEIERPAFVRYLKAMGQESPGAFGEFWEVVEREYRRLCKSPSS